MAKVNVNSATRDDLVNVAGLRPEIADAVLEFRREHHRIVDAQALEELPGVGPTTVEQLRRALDFGDKGGNGHAQARAGEKEAGRSAERATEAASSAARSGAEAARQAAEGGARVASTAAREGTEIV